MRYLLMSLMGLLLTACAGFSPPLEESPPPVSDNAGPAFLGIGYRPVREVGVPTGESVAHARQITRIMADSPAARADLRVGDILLTYDDRAFSEDTSLLNRYLAEQKSPGDGLKIRLLRPATQITARRDGEPLALRDEEQASRAILARESGETLEIQLTPGDRLLTFEVILGAPPSPPPPPDPAILFPGLERARAPETPALMDIIQACGLNTAYRDVLQRYHQDQGWNHRWSLGLVQHARLNPLDLPAIGRHFSDSLAAGFRLRALPEALGLAAGGLEIPLPDFSGMGLPPADSALKLHLAFIQHSLQQAAHWQHRAVAGLEPAEVRYFMEKVPHSGIFFLNPYETPAAIAHNERLLALATKLDYASLIRAGQHLARLAHPDWLADFRRALAQLPDSGLKLEKVRGELLLILDTPAGRLIVGGEGDNIYENPEAALIFDLGGNDFYQGNAGGATPGRPLSLLVDFAGDDEYAATSDAAQGSGVFGVGLLLDLAGNDVYTGARFTQGSGLLGVGLLADLAGDDLYLAREYAQGAALWGLGLLLDESGDDQYRATLLAQGMGGPKGLGLLLDRAGEDRYHASGHHPGTYGSEGIFSGFAQGMGLGFRPYTAGGLGLLRDGAGRDHYRAGNFSQGGGYFFALGILHDAGGQADDYLASRYGQGFAAHSAAGLLLEDGGDDIYRGFVGALQSAAWDLSNTALVDAGGNDEYHGARFFSQAAAAHNGLALLWDRDGADRYHFPSPEKVTANHYHGGHSLSLWLDLGQGEDRLWQNRQALDAHPPPSGDASSLWWDQPQLSPGTCAGDGP